MIVSWGPIFDKFSYHYCNFDIYFTLYSIKIPLGLFDSCLIQAVAILYISGSQEEEQDL